jgi:uncharacterized membrane protein YdjX (TVP38/TMEM64 family)
MKSPFRRWPLTSGLVLMLATALIVLGFGLWGLEPVTRLLLNVDGLIQAHFWTALAIYMASFIVLASLAVPIGSLYCLTAGYLFGIPTGASAALICSVISAGLTFVGVRHFSDQGLRQRLEAGRLAGLLLILERDANWYLVLLRVVPIAPFFLINAAAAITRISARHFHLATLAGLLPTTIIYASLGSGIGSILDAPEMMGPELLLRPEVGLPIVALAALIVVSWAVKRHLSRRLHRAQSVEAGRPSS